jgi:hypothetical protein
MAWWLGGGLSVFLAWGPRWSDMASTIYDKESLRHGIVGSRRQACYDELTQ